MLRLMSIPSNILSFVLQVCVPNQTAFLSEKRNHGSASFATRETIAQQLVLRETAKLKKGD